MAGKHPHFLKFKMKKREQEARRKRGETNRADEVSKDGDFKSEEYGKVVLEEKKMSKKQKKKMKKLTEVSQLEHLFEKVVENKVVKKVESDKSEYVKTKRGHSDDSAPIPAKVSKFCFAKLKK